MKLKIVLAAALLSAMSTVAFAQQGPGGGLRAADGNGDGNITRAEFDAAQTARFDRMDADHNGSLSQAERTPPAGAGGPPPGGPPPGAGQGGQGFNPDANNDGMVSREEYAAAGGQRFDRMDANHDGTIQSTELPAPPPR